nr:unnamed protein product [Digitaria exilis]
MASAVVQVFGQPASTDVARVMACLLERNLEFQLVRTDTFRRGHKIPEFDLSGKVVLKHGDTTLSVPTVVHQGPRACIEKWLQAETQSFDAPSAALAFHLAVSSPATSPHDDNEEDEEEEERHAATVAESERWLARVLDVYDEALGRSAYLAGDEFTLADLSHLPNAHYVAALLASRGNVARWYAAISARPAWRQVRALPLREAASEMRPQPKGASCCLQQRRSVLVATPCPAPNSFLPPNHLFPTHRRRVPLSTATPLPRHLHVPLAAVHRHPMACTPCSDEEEEAPNAPTSIHRRSEKMPAKVFGSPASSEVARVMTCLFEKDVEFQLIRVDSFRGPKRMPQYLKLQPHGEALSFEDGGVTLVELIASICGTLKSELILSHNAWNELLNAESRKILRHIADKYKNQGNKDLFGPGALERASIEQWLQTEAQSFDIPSAEMVYSLSYLPPDMPLDTGRGGLLPVGGMHPSHRQKMEEMLQRFEKSRKDLGKLLDIYEQRLGEEEFLAGSKFTLADLSHLPNADRLAADPRSARLIESRKNVSRWLYTISGRDSWRRVKELQRPPSAEAPF